MKVWTLMLKENPVHRFIVYEGRPVTIGRTSETDVVLDNPSISREHAVVEVVDGRAYLTDKGSTNGTTVNGKKISGRTQITDNDEIMVGKFNMVPGSIGILDVENKSQSILADDDAHTMYAPPTKKTLPTKEKPPSALRRLTNKIFKK